MSQRVPLETLKTGSIDFLAADATASQQPPRRRGSVVIVGGGLAGLAAGCALADAGMKVTLLEARPYVGGRASSYEHPGTGEVVDNCQHVLLGCCTNLIDLYRRLGVQDKIRWFSELVFVEPGGHVSKIKPSALPAPMHTSLSFLAAGSLTFRDKSAIARAMFRMMLALPEDSAENFAQWLQRHGQTPRAIERFWKPVLVSALNEDLDRMSVHYAVQVFRESFLKSRDAGKMGIPTVPLSELYGAAVDYIRSRGGDVKLRASVTAFQSAPASVSVRTGEGQVIADYAILAIPFDALARLMPQESFDQTVSTEKLIPQKLTLGSTQNGAGNLKAKLQHFEHSPITGIHLWFDRPITSFEHAVLLDRTIQWMFHKSALQGIGKKESYVELVVSASKSLVEKSRQEIIDLALQELIEFFPEAKEAKLVKATVIKEVKATYSIQPLSDQYRPGSESPWPRIFLAGDWTATGWPATMEGAVRSGYKAAEAVMRARSEPKDFLIAGLPAQGLMRLFG